MPGIAGGDQGEFILRVKGDSMKDAGILEATMWSSAGRTPPPTARSSWPWWASEATVKRFFRESDHVRLQPENEALEPIRVRDVEVLGRVVGVCRRVS